jgi:hypothetical protein
LSQRNSAGEASEAIMKVALFTQDMSGGAFGAVFSGLANALAANGVAAIELLTVKGDMARPEHPFPARAGHIRLPGGGWAGALWSLRRHLLRFRPDEREKSPREGISSSHSLVPP